MDTIDEELMLMEQEVSTSSEQRSVYSVIRDPSLLLPVILVVLLMGCQQLSGLNAASHFYICVSPQCSFNYILQVWYYSVSIFQSAGLTASDAKWANLGVGFINFLSVCLSPILLTHLNRRPLLLVSSFFTSQFLIILTFVVEYNVKELLSVQTKDEYNAKFIVSILYSI